MKDVMRKASRVQQEQARRSFGNITYYNFNKGQHTLRFLPPGVDADSLVIPRVDDNIFAFPVYQHKRIPGQEGRQDGIERVRCIRNTYPERGLACPVCDAEADYKKWAEQAGLSEDEMKAHGMTGKNGHYLHGQAFANAIDRNGNLTASYQHEGRSVEAPLIQMAALHIQGIYNPLILFNAQDSFDNFTDADEGLDTYINVQPKKNGWGNEYQVSLVPRSGPLYKDPNKSADENSFIIDALLHNMIDISKLFAFPTKERYDEIIAAAAIIKSLIGGKPSPTATALAGRDDAPRSAPAPADDRPRAALSSKKNYPGCFKNFTDGRDECEICIVDVECKTITAKVNPTDEAKEHAYAQMDKDPSLRFDPETDKAPWD
jgi:hypothetical protein